MRLDWRDWVATVCVAAAVALYGVWLAGVALTASSGIRVVAGCVLGLGIVASAFAVVPGFEQLLQGSRTYLVIASLLGLGAFVTGVIALVNLSEVMLATLVGATAVLWAMATTRHILARGEAVSGAAVPRAVTEDMRKAA